MTVAPATLAAASAVLARRAGLRSEESMRSRLERCLDDAARRSATTVDAFVARLDSDPAALQSLVDHVTVQESAFFRDPAQFDALATGVLPTIGRPTTIWSAACANGQEPFSLAMLLDAQGDTTSTVIASDISMTALERTRAATYSGREIAGLDEEHRRRYLRRSGPDAWTVVDEIRDRVEVLRVNLASDAPPFDPGACPVIFCRNVMIYFGHEQIVRLLKRFEQWLAPDGVVFLGYSESLWQVTDRFELERMGSAFVYRRRHRPGVRSDVRQLTASRATSTRTRPAPPQRPVGPVDARPIPPRRAAPTPDPRVHPAPSPATDSVAAPSPATDPVATPSSATPTLMAPTSATPSPASPVLSVEEMISVGLSSMRSGELAEAVAAFRRCAYLHPDSVEAHTHLAFALEAAGDHGAARRAFSVARTTLEHSAPEEIESALQGYRPDELARLLDRKLEESR